MHDEGIKKLYYSIGEVCDATGLEAHVLRYWETEFEQLQPRKNRAGRRIYTDDDLAMVRRIQHLLRVNKYTIEGARQVLADEHDDPLQTDARLRQMNDLRILLCQMLEKLDSEH